MPRRPVVPRRFLSNRLSGLSQALPAPSLLGSWALALVCALVLLAWVPAVAAAGVITVTHAPAPSVVFGASLTFELAAHSTAGDISAVVLHLQAGQEPPFAWRAIDFEPGAQVDVVATIDAAPAALPPFSPVLYWWELQTRTGVSLTTEPAEFYYEDDRFQWQRLTSGTLTLHWYDGGPEFGQNALETAVAAYSQANRDIRAPLPERLDLYIYANPSDVQAALQRVGVAWADGHADVNLGVVIVVTSPDLSADFNFQREIPHELTHILIHRAAGENYRHVPAWFNEGLASLNQTQPEPDFPALLAAARQSGEFLDFAALCGSFPADPARARLAYAQSESLTRYLRDRYGSEQVNQLLAAYVGGAACSEGVEAVLGRSLDDLQQQWLTDAVHGDTTAARLQLLAPWLLLAALVLAGPLIFFLLIVRPARPR